MKPMQYIITGLIALIIFGKVERSSNTASAQSKGFLITKSKARQQLSGLREELPGQQAAYV
jgi:hypothetical protein